jgi:transposase
MDELSAHKGPRVEQLVEAAGGKLRYQPPYSPDIEPIEKATCELKASLRRIAARTVAGSISAHEASAHIF